MYQLCLIPGLGVDERIFQFLSLPPQFPRTVIRWLPPLKGESLPSYAGRLLEQLPDRDKVILIGVSFGGLLAVEMAKIIQPARIIIISGIKHRQELPPYYRPAGKLRLPYFLPIQWGKHLGWLQRWLFGPETAAEAQLLHQIIRETDPSFVRWALTQVANWENEEIPPGIIHLHGTRDKLFPTRFLLNFTPVPGGEHFMVVSQAEQISRHLREAIRSPA